MSAHTAYTEWLPPVHNGAKRSLKPVTLRPGPLSGRGGSNVRKPRSTHPARLGALIACGMVLVGVATACSDEEAKSRKSRATATGQSSFATAQPSGGGLARPGDPEQTRLIGGPILFRVTGAPKPTETDLTAEVAYTLVFRLSRRNIRGGSANNYGAFDVAGGAVDVYPFGPKRRNCFAADLRRADDQFDPSTMRQLDALPVGHPVRVMIKPRTRLRDGSTEPGQRYFRQPTLRKGVFRLKDAAGKRELKRIGCSGLTS